jgi:hypothetical protein
MCLPIVGLGWNRIFSRKQTICVDLVYESGGGDDGGGDDGGGGDGGGDGGDGGWCLNYLKKIKRLHFIIFFQIVVSRISRNLLGRWDHSDQSIYARR